VARIGPSVHAENFLGPGLSSNLILILFLKKGLALGREMCRI